MNKFIQISLWNMNNKKMWEVLFFENNEVKDKILEEYDWIENKIKLGEMLSYFIKLNDSVKFSYNWIKFNIIEFDLILPALLKQHFPNFNNIYKNNKNFII